MPVTGTNTHPGGRLVDVFHHPMLTGSEHLAPDRMMSRKHRKPPGGMDRFFPGLIPAILDDGDHVEPRPVLISIPRGNAVRLRLLNNKARMFPSPRVWWKIWAWTSMPATHARWRDGGIDPIVGRS